MNERLEAIGVRLRVSILLLVSLIHGESYGQDSKTSRRAAHLARMEGKAKKLAAGHVPCSSSAMEVQDLETTWTTMAYTIHCKGKSYRCSVQDRFSRCFKIDDEEAPVAASFVQRRPSEQIPPRSETILVFPIDDSTKTIGADVVGNLTDYVGVQLARTQRYRLVPREQLRDRLREESKGTYRACFDEACQIELGKELAAEKIASAKIYLAGTACILSVTIYDLATAASERAASSRSDCSAASLFNSVEAVTAEITNAPSLRYRDGQGQDAEPRLVVFTSKPPGARVFVDDKAACSTPCQWRVSPGPHEIRLQKIGHAAAKRSINVVHETPPVSIQLVELQAGERKPLLAR